MWLNHTIENSITEIMKTTSKKLLKRIYTFLEPLFSKAIRFDE